MLIREMWKTVRKSRGVTIKEVSERTGISASMISKYERGKTNISDINLEIMCNSIGTKLAIIYE